MKKIDAPALISGSKGGSVTRTADNLFSTDVVEAILAVSEGPIKGLADGPKSFYVGDTPLLDPVGKNNFDGFELIAREGGVLGEKITPRMGGFGTSTNVGVELAPQTPVVRAGYQTEIDYIDIRLVVSRLSKDNDDGSFEHTGKVKIEYRKSGVSAWTPVRTPEAEPFPEQEAVTGGAVYRNYGNNPAQIAAAVWDYVSTVANNALAAANAKMGTWFKADENYKPYQWSGEAWTPVEGATRTGKVWTFNGRRVTYSTEPPANRVVGEGWIHTDSNLHKIWNGDAWVKGGSSFEPGGVGSNGTGGKITVDAGEISIFGKTTSAFVKELRIPVENGPHTYEVRVTRTSPANTDELFFDVSWESFQELSVEPMKFPGVATIQLTARASEQFSSIPEFSGVFEGRTVKVPSNYDPKTRKYEGLWDGTWKVDYTNNPAFIGLDLIENNRYGLSAYYPVTVNKFDIYEAGQWCDTKAADGSPRFTFNGVIDTPRDGREAINYVFGLFGGRFFDDGNGTGVIRLDQDSAAVAVFSPENVEGGVFTYAQTPLASRHNDITVTFINPALNWQEDRRRVFDQDNIDTYGRNATSMVAVGCTSVEEAIRRGRYRLVTGLTEKTTVGFTTNRMGAFLQPYDVILVADQDYDFGLHGRVQSIVDANTIQLRDPIYLEPGISYRVSFTVIDTVSDEYTVVTLNIASGQSGNRTTLNLTSSLPGDVLAGSVFTVHQTGTTIAPKPFRVLDIENDADSEKVKISAIEINRAKWPYVDGRIDEIEYNGFYDLKTSQIPEPVTNPRVTVKSQKQGKRVIRTMNFSWDPSPSTFVTKYRLSASANGGPMTQLAEVASLRHEWRDIAPANYVFTVEPIGKNGILGRATTFEHKMLRASEDLDTIGNLTLSNAGTVRPDGVFTPMLVASWDAYTEETISEYQVQWKTSTATKWQNASVEDPSFELPNPVAGETYELRVRAVADATILTKWAKASSFVQVDTLAPPVPTNWRGKANFDAVVLRGDRSPANDFRGFRVYASTATSTVLVFLSEHRGNIITLTPEAADIFTRYKISAIDYAGNESAKTDYIEAAPIVNPATVVPNAPTGLIVTSVVIDQHRSRVKVDWNVSPEVGVVGYKVKVRPATGAATITPAGVTHFEFDWTVNTNVYVSVCAENVMGQLGAYSAEVLHKAIKDSTPPAVPTGLKANPGLKLLALEWGKVADADLKEYEVYVHTAATPAPTTGTTPTFVTGVSAYVVTGLGDEENRWFWVRSVDHAGNKSAWSSSASGKTLAAPGVNQQQLQGMIDRTSFAAGVEPVEVRSTLPGTPHVQGRLVALTTDGKLYRNTGSGWTAAVDAADISGQVAAAQIAALEASKITGQLSAAQIASIEAAKVSGQLTSAQIASIEASKLTGQLVAAQLADAQITAAKLTAGLKAIEIVGTLPGAPHTQGRTVLLTTDNKLYRNTGSGWTAAVAATDMTGQLTDAQIAAVSAAKLAGQLTDAQIAAIDAAKLTGTINEARLASLDASKLTGTINEARIAGLAASKVTGQLSASQIASLEAAKISGQLTDAQIANIAASKMTGQVVAAQIAAAAIDATKLTSGLKAIEIVSTLPGAPHTQGRTVLLTTDNKLYRNTGAGWTAAVAASDMSGQLTSAQVADLDAAKLTGTIVEARLASLDAAKLTGTVNEARIAGLAASKVTGQLSDSQIAAVATTKLTGQIADTQIAQMSATKLLGTVPEANLASLAASKITGTLSSAQIASLEAAKVSGQLTNAQIADVAASKMTGQVVATQIADAAITAAKLTSGLKAIEIVSTLPGTPHTQGRTVLLTTDNKIYRNTGSGWTAAVASADISGQIAAAQIAALEASKITGTLTSAQIASLDAAKLTSQITSTQISDNAISSPKIAAGAVTAGKVGANAITANEIAADSITTAKIAANAVTAAEIAAGAIVAGKIAAGAIVAADIASGAITTAKLAANAVTANEIAAGTITGAKIAAQTISGSNIITDTITATQLAAGAVTATQLAAGAVTAGKIAANAVTANEIAASTITGAKIATNTITATQIATGAITAAEIASGAITTAKIGAGAVTAAEIAAGAIVAGKIAAGAIGADEIAANTIVASKLVLGDLTNAYGDYDMVDPGFYSSTTGHGVSFIGTTSGSLGKKYGQSSGASGAGVEISIETLWQPLDTSGDLLVQGGVWLSSTTANSTGTLEIEFGSVDTAGVVTPTRRVLVGSRYNSSSANAFTIYETNTSSEKVFRFVVSRDTAGTAALHFGGFVVRRRANAQMIVDGSITTAKLVANAVTANEIASNAITSAKIAAGAITAGKIAAGTIVAADIASGAITAGKIAAGTITANDIAASTITGAKIAASTITGSNIVADTITATQLAASAVTATQLAAGAVTAGKIAAGTVTANDIAAGTITGAKIAASTITGSNIVTNTITATQIAAGTITGTEIKADAITASHIAANAVTAEQIAASTITGAKIAGSTITGSNIAANTITATQIAASTITAAEIAAGTITGAKIAAGTIAASNIAADTITADKLATNSITAKQLAVGDFTNFSAGSDFENAATVPWSLGTSWTLSTTQKKSGTTSLRCQGSLTGTCTLLQPIQVQEGDEIYAELWMYRDSSWNGTTSNSKLRFGSQAGTHLLSVTYDAGNAANTWIKRSASFTVPAGTTSLSVTLGNDATAGYVYLDEIVIRKKNDGAMLIDGTVEARHLVANSITSAQIAAGTITAAEIAGSTITGSKIAAATITGANIVADTITATQIAAGTITGTQIKADTITATHIAASTITATQIAAGTITGAKIAASTITGSNIVTNTITATQIAAGTITGAEIKADAITATHIAANAVTAEQIAASVITGSKIAGSTITGSNIAANTITATQIAANTITATEIKAGTITAAEIAGSTITGSKIASNTITATQIAASTITAAEIASNAITTAKIAAGAVGADQIAAGSIIAKNLAVTDFTNLVPNGSADDIDISGMWNTPTSGGTFTVAAGLGVSGANAFKLAKGSDLASETYTTISPGYFIPIEGSEKYYAETALWTDGTATTAGAYFRVYWYDKSKVYIGYATIANNVPMTATKVQYSLVLTAPSSARYATIRVYNGSGQTTTKNVYFDRFVLRLMNGAQLVVDGTIQGKHLSADTITAREIAGGTITATQIASGTITGTQIKADTITATHIAANTITATQIAAGTITGAQIKTDTITATQIASGTITATQIASGTITGSRIAGRTITAGLIASDTITANEIAASTITATQIAAGTITGSKLAADTIQAKHLVIGSRAISLTGIEFEHNSPSTNRADWNSGSIVYTDDDGVEQTRTIAAGSTSTWTSGVIYIYWIKDTGNFNTTTSRTAATGTDRRIIATYEGGTKLDADYGRTIVDGSKIKTGTINANRLEAKTITAAKGVIGDFAVDTLQIAGNAVSTNKSVQQLHSTPVYTSGWSTVLSKTVTLEHDADYIFIAEVDSRGESNSTSTFTQIRITVRGTQLRQRTYSSYGCPMIGMVSGMGYFTSGSALIEIEYAASGLSNSSTGRGCYGVQVHVIGTVK